VSEDPPLYEIEDLTRIYRMGEVEVRALVGVDLRIPVGELLVILGPSGSGKSTLLNLLGGMDRPTRGRIRFRDEDLGDHEPQALTMFRRRHVGFVFQFYNLIPSLTAVENVEMATELAVDPRDPMEMLALVDLGDRAHHFPSQLSGGEQQRVAIARAIAKNPEVLLCDEPTGALDYRTGKLVLEMLQQVNRELGTSVILITHNAAIGDMGDRVVRMGSGRIVEVRENEAPLRPEDIEW
jgi:putative ABC transport system ATP-binding protein